MVCLLLLIRLIRLIEMACVYSIDQFIQIVW